MGQNSCTCAGSPTYFEPTGSTGRMKEPASDTLGTRPVKEASPPVISFVDIGNLRCNRVWKGTSPTCGLHRRGWVAGLDINATCTRESLVAIGSGIGG
eukprot:3625031-Rhodomonas_salina.1